MNTNTLKLQRKIMRRIYLAFAKRLVTHPITMQVATFSLALVVFAKLVHVHRVIETLSSSTLANVPAQAFNVVSTAFMRGEVLTLIAVGALVFLALSLPWQAFKIAMPKQYAALVVKA